MAYGPVNYANQGDESPFGGLDNRINYNNMVKHQMVSQYANGVLPPSTLPLHQQRQIATEQRFQYGVEGGQDPRFYERQAQLSRHGRVSAIAQTMTSLAMYGMADVATISAGAKFFSPLGLGLMAGASVPAYFVGQGFKRNLERQKYMASLSSDVEQYRDQLGFTGGLSYSQATQLGRNLQESIYKPGFFNKEQKMEIHKIGLSNNLISAKGAGGVGNIKQYQKNVEELIATTEDIVKLLNTTKEGGMSVIKELQNSGFNSIGQIRQQVKMAKTAGGFTGIGAQNMMALGNAGAQAVQGTPWSASVGASSYQMGAVQAQMISGGSSAGAYAVRRVGGVATAGAAIGNFQMNVLQSGIGSRLAAYSMNADGSVNQQKLNRMLSGKASTFEIVNGANSTGFQMGENRVRFGMFKEDLWNQMSDMDRTRATMVSFNKWSEQRPYSSIENKAYAFAGRFTNNSRDQRLMYENLLSSKDFSRLTAMAGVDRAMINQSAGGDIGMKATYNRASNIFNKTMDNAAAFSTNVTENIFNNKYFNYEGMKQRIKKKSEKWLVRNTNYDVKADGGDYQAGIENVYGMNDIIPLRRTDRFSYYRKAALVKPTNTGLKGKEILNRLKYSSNDEFGGDENVKYVLQRITSFVGNNRTKDLFDDKRFRTGFTEDQLKRGEQNPQAFVLEAIRSIQKFDKSHDRRFEEASSGYHSYVKNLKTSGAMADANHWKSAIDHHASKGSINLDTKLSYGQFRTNKKDGTMTFGMKGASSAQLAYAEEVWKSQTLKGVDKELLSQAEAAAQVDISVKYGHAAFKSQKLRDEFKEFKLGTAQGKADFAAALYDSHAGGDVTVMARAQAAGMSDANITSVLKKRSKVVNALNTRTGGARARTFMDQFDKSKTQNYTQLEKLMSNIYSGKIDKNTVHMLSDENFGKQIKQGLSIAPERFDNIVKEAIKTKDYSGIQNLVGNNAAGKEMSRLDMMKSDLVKMEKLLNNTKKSVNLQTVDGGTTMKKGEGGSTEEAIRIAYGNLQSQVNEAQKNQDKYQMPSTVRSPVLNYWNNRWVL